MTDVPSLIARARLEMGDVARPFQTQVQGDGALTEVKTWAAPIDHTTVVVTKTDSVLGTTTLNQGADYTVDERNGIVLLTTPLAATAVLNISGTAYRYFTDTDWTTFVSTAITDHIHNRQEVRDISFLPVEEEYPVALLAVVMALYALLNDATFDIDIATPEGVSIPRHQRYEQIQGMLAARLDQYNKWCSAFNVGLWRIEMFDLRRVSLTTNRLIPIYTPQELADTRFPMQQFPPIDTHGPRETPAVVYQQVINLTAYSNQNFSYTFTLGYDITGKTVKCQARRYPQALVPFAYFTVVVDNWTTGQITISMTGSMTYYLGVNKFWDCELVDADGSVTTVVGGTFDAIRQGNYG